MQRVIKRFLLHKQSENDEIKLSDFDEIKQDLQMVRYEVLNEMTKSSDETLKYISLIQNGVLVIGNEIVSDSNDFAIQERFKQYQNMSLSDLTRLDGDVHKQADISKQGKKVETPLDNLANMSSGSSAKNGETSDFDSVSASEIVPSYLPELQAINESEETKMVDCVAEDKDNGD
jgi:hypothetical protein